MRTISKSRKHFLGTHKGCQISIEREPARDPCSPFYIMVMHSDGGHLYDGWAPDSVTTMAEAKREALYGSTLKARPSKALDRGGGGLLGPVHSPETRAESNLPNPNHSRNTGRG